MTFLDELYLIGTLADDHDTEYDGGHYVTPSLMRRSDLEWIVAVLEKVTRGAEVGGHPTVETGNLRAILNRDEQEN